jgi:hypothetical protein
MAFLVIAILLQLYVLYVWTTLYRIVKRRIWVLVFLGIVVITIYRLTEVAASHSSAHYILAFLNSLFFAWAAGATRIEMRAQKKAADHLKVIIHAKVEPEPVSFAAELAKVLNDIRSKLEYYEKQADDHKLPRFPE